MHYVPVFFSSVSRIIQHVQAVNLLSELAVNLLEDPVD